MVAFGSSVVNGVVSMGVCSVYIGVGDDVVGVCIFLFLFENIDGVRFLYFLVDFILPRKSFVSGLRAPPPPLLFLVDLNDDMEPYRKQFCTPPINISNKYNFDHIPVISTKREL